MSLSRTRASSEIQHVALIGRSKVTNRNKNTLGPRSSLGLAITAIALTALSGCALNSKYPPVPPDQRSLSAQESYLYEIAPGDSVEIFVWAFPELSGTVPVRPDGMLTTPLIEDMAASGKTPSELARDLEKEMALYVRSPIVTVIVNKFVGLPQQQVRVVGEAMGGSGSTGGSGGSGRGRGPAAVPFRKHMTLLDLMIEVGGLTPFAAGNKSILVRFNNGQRKEYSVRIDDLIRKGDMSENVSLLPGDILIIPEAWF
ncbi:MAG: polysaccharide export protein [Chromatiaceae bacterium]|nr:polysaccharide export protein [Chromatiaceae bacterium]